MLYRPCLTGFLTAAIMTGTTASAVELCHVANAGFLIRGENASVLLDGLMEEDQYGGRFALPSEDMLGDMMNKEGLFQHLSLVLATHRHGDHFDPRATIRNIRSTEEVLYAVPADAVPTLEANGITAAEHNRLIVIEDGPQSSFEHAGVSVQTFDVDHGPDMPQNIGYRVTVDDVSFFHTGDISASRSQLSGAGVNALAVDALIMPFWFGFQNPEQRATIEASWTYKTVIPTHFNPKPAPWMQQIGGLEGVKNSVSESFRNSTIITDEGKCVPIE